MSYRIEIHPDDPQSIQRALNTEWLLTNGLGGYAMGTALGVNTRRYHGLLVAATKPPVGRIVALHSMIEQLIVPREDGSEEIIELSTQQFVGGDGEPMLHPSGWRTPVIFEPAKSSLASWTFLIGAGSVIRRIHTGYGLESCLMSYSFNGLPQGFSLRLRPLVALRDFHSLNTAADESFAWRQSASAFTVSRRANELQCAWNPQLDPRVEHDPQWWNDFCYSLDKSRGQDFRESIWSPCCLRFKPSLSQSVDLSFGTASPQLKDLEFPNISNRRLRHSASCFVVHRKMGESSWATSATAGYPWFGDWGRDTMIALPGLMLCTERFDEARSCLMLYAQHLRNGLIPNVFDDYGGAAHYNTADASLWFVHAVHALWNSQRRIDNELLHACREIIGAYQNGTDFNIFMDVDGLISAGEEGSQLTWMDAKRDGVVFTPRHGKAVEINALWFNALNCLAEMTDDQREREDLRVLGRKAAESFRAKFWWKERTALYDVLNPNANQNIRPNQIFAVSLPFSPLNGDQQRAVVRIVEERLLTSLGLRTLDRDDPDYRGRYEGNLFERDRAYHNGTVWPWLIGPFCEALFRVDNFSAPSKQRVRSILQPLIDEMSNTEGGRCLGQIAEVYDGDPPHRPSGCPAQAWSVAEVLRILTLIETPAGFGT